MGYGSMMFDVFITCVAKKHPIKGYKLRGLQAKDAKGHFIDLKLSNANHAWFC